MRRVIWLIYIYTAKSMQNQPQECEECELVFKCPHCREFLLVEQINCAIFRHGVYKTTGKPIDPHSPQPVCESLVAQNAIYGCGKPFQLIKREDGQYSIRCCGYI
jgi:hypothetical protein